MECLSLPGCTKPAVIPQTIDAAPLACNKRLWYTDLGPHCGSLFDFDPTQWAGPYKEPDDSRTQQLTKAARTFATIWATGDPSPAESILAEDVKEQNLLFGRLQARPPSLQGHHHWCFQGTFVLTDMSCGDVDRAMAG